MWLSRIGVQRRHAREQVVHLGTGVRETPREAIDAFALADLAKASKADVDVAASESAWASLAGGREDMGLEDLALVRREASVADLRPRNAFVRLRTA